MVIRPVLRPAISAFVKGRRQQAGAALQAGRQAGRKQRKTQGKKSGHLLHVFRPPSRSISPPQPTLLGRQPPALPSASRRVAGASIQRERERSPTTREFAHHRKEGCVVTLNHRSSTTSCGKEMTQNEIDGTPALLYVRMLRKNT